MVKQEKILFYVTRKWKLKGIIIITRKLVSVIFELKGLYVPWALLRPGSNPCIVFAWSYVLINFLYDILTMTKTTAHLEFKFFIYNFVFDFLRNGGKAVNLTGSTDWDLLLHSFLPPRAEYTLTQELKLNQQWVRKSRFSVHS